MSKLNERTKKAIAGLDKTTVAGLAEVIGIAMCSLTDSTGRHVMVRLSNDMSENLFLLEQLASILLGVNDE